MKGKKLHILFISSWFPTSRSPFDGNFVIRHAEAVARVAEVSFINVTKDPLKNKEKLLISNKISMFESKIKNYTFPFVSYIFSSIQKAYLIWKLYRKVSKERGKPDLIHANVVFPSGLLALVLKLLTSTPYIITEHWTGYLNSNYRNQNIIKRILSKLAAKGAAVITPVTENLKHAMISNGFKNDYKVVPNVTNLDYFFPSDSKRTSKKKTLLHISSLIDEHKNITGIINVVKELSLNRDDFVLIIIGDGNSKPHVEYAEKLNLKDRFIKFFGSMSPGEIGEFMRNSDCLLLFSNYENFPCVIVEAFATGIPVISTDVGGIREHLTPDKGILIKSGDEQECYNAIDSMLNNLDAYRSLDIHNYAVKNFSYEAVGEKYLTIYKQVLAGKNEVNR